MSGGVTKTPAALKGDTAFETLRREIVSCRIRPGATLSEPEVMESFGLGKATCRVALQRLAACGLVQAIPRQGYRVSAVTLKYVEDLFELRLLLEPRAARLAAEAGKCDIGKLERLEEMCRKPRPRDIGNQIDFFLEANRSFHMAIARASGNARLCTMLGGIYDEMGRLVALGFGDRGARPNIEGDHIKLIAAMATGDGDKAEAVARRHVEVFRADVMATVNDSLRSSGVVEALNLVTVLKGAGE